MKHTDIPVILRVSRREYNGRPYAAFTILFDGKEYAVSLARARTQLRRELVKQIDINAPVRNEENWEECNPDEA